MLHPVMVFQGRDTSGQIGLWVSDGTIAGTHEVASIAGALSSGSGLSPSNIAAYGGEVLFSGADAADHQALWVSDGVGSGTRDLTGIVGADPARGITPTGFVSYNGKLMFAGDSPSSIDLWTTDGTVAGTTPISSVAGAGPAGLQPRFLTPFDGLVFFSGETNSVTGAEGLWTTDGTSSGTHQIGPISGVSSLGVVPSDIVVFNGALFFSGANTSGQGGLWTSDGTPGGTVQLAIAGGSSSGIVPRSITVFGSGLVFSGYDTSFTNNLWVSDGGAAGTHELTGIVGANAETGVGLEPTNLFVANGELFLEGLDASGQQGIWVSDGTAAGTHELTGIVGAATGGINPSNFAALNGAVYFEGADSTGQEGLWETNGTAAGTRELTNIIGAWGNGGLTPQDLTVATLNIPTTVSDDFTGVGRSDILFQGSDGSVAQWQMNGAQVVGGGIFGGASAGTNVVATGDFTGDGESDVLLQQGASLTEWLMSGTQVVGGGEIGALSSGWTVAGAGVLTNSGNADLVLAHANGDGTTDVAAWLLAGSEITGGGEIGTLGNGWSIAGIGDFNGDGQSDLLLAHANGDGTTDVAQWRMNGTSVTGGGEIATLSAGWTIAGVGDFNGDGLSDLLLAHANGDGATDVAEWQMNGTSVTGGGEVGTLSTGWSIAGIGDFNGDGKADLLLQNGADLVQWLLNGTQVVGGGGIGALTAPWTTAT